MSEHIPDWQIGRNIQEKNELELDADWKVKINLKNKKTNINTLVKKNYEREKKKLEFTVNHQKFKELPALIMQDRIDYLKRNQSSSLFEQSNDLCNYPVIKNVKLCQNEQKKNGHKKGNNSLFPPKRKIYVNEIDILNNDGDNLHNYIKEQSEEDENIYPNEQLYEKKKHIREILKYGYGNEQTKYVKQQSTNDIRRQKFEVDIHQILKRILKMPKLKEKIDEKNIENLLDERDQNRDKMRKRMVKKEKLQSLESISFLSSQQRIQQPSPSVETSITATTVIKENNNRQRKKMRMYGKFIFPQPPSQLIKPTPVIS